MNAKKTNNNGMISKDKQSFNVANASRWTMYFIAIGLIAGLGSVLFHYLCQLGIHYFLDMAAGYRPPAPAGEHHLLPQTATPFNRWILLFLPALGGLVSGVLVYTFAPEAEGHGTDAAIEAYHHKGGFIRGIVPIIKTITSAITLTTGGSGGREGPIAQIGAGFGSFLATKLKLSVRERRIMMAAGISAGVGSIFRAPLAGALFAAEVLYKDPEFESEVIIPAGISSVVAYCVFCLVYGWGSLFSSPDFVFRNPMELGPYLVLAFVLVATGIFYVKSFYGVTGFYRRMRIPNHIKPMIGGLITGMIGFFLPHCLAFGYGFAQKALLNELTIPFLLTLAIGKVLTTSFSIGSGGSGGVFGPSIVIGGAMGGAVGKIFHLIMPGIVTQPGAFVIVGMAGFFTAVSNTPISTIIFVSEMTNSYHLLLPSLLVCSVSYIISQKWTIYVKQVKNRIESPAHAGDFNVDVLQAYHVSDLEEIYDKIEMQPFNMTYGTFKNKILPKCENRYFPLKDMDGKLFGIFSSTDIRPVMFSENIDNIFILRDFVKHGENMLYTTPSEDLNSVLQKFTLKNIDSLPIVKDNDTAEYIGMLNRRALIAFYNERINRIKNRIEAEY